ncbi:uncharacterized protein BJX67DRAFT_370670 [Aspergillus lucknowensis]|uniref:Rhodopsin domain-containing protein n=1 Tax=Aspergillus lucknowensis TaxID=176173 RepID=A0ABR4LZB0_9EURO
MAKMPTQDEIAWMQAHINDSTVPDIIACCSVCAAASVIILTLRIWSRLQTRRQLVLSDNLVISSVLNILNPILYGVATTLVKWSILALYIAIFPQKNFQYWIYFLCVINCLNAVSIVLVSCLQCHPLDALWNPAVGGTCIDFSIFSLFNTSFNLVLDVVILLSPLKLVMNLNLSRRKKVLLAFNFGLGGGACVVAAIRLPYARRVGGTSDPSWDMIPGGLLCVVEVTVALLCASLPIYRPLFQRMVSGHSTAGNSQQPGLSHGASDYIRSGGNVSTRITASKRHSSHRGGINITENISMKTHTYVSGRWVPMPDDDDEAYLVPGTKGSRSTTPSNSNV